MAYFITFFLGTSEVMRASPELKNSESSMVSEENSSLSRFSSIVPNLSESLTGKSELNFKELNFLIWGFGTVVLLELEQIGTSGTKAGQNAPMTQTWRLHVKVFQNCGGQVMGTQLKKSRKNNYKEQLNNTFYTESFIAVHKYLTQNLSSLPILYRQCGWPAQREASIVTLHWNNTITYLFNINIY